jgi:hypothetical protein
MKRKILISESELVSLLKTIIMENNPKACDLQKLNVFSQPFQGQIKSNGVKVFETLKTKKRKVLDKFLENKGIILTVGDENYLKKNLEDINFAINNLKLSSNLELDILSKKKEIINTLNPSLGYRSSKLEHFREGDKWSLINKFDTNILLWKSSILHFYNSHPEYKNLVDESKDCSDAINIFFNKEFLTYENFKLTFGEYAFLENISENFEKAKSIVSRTSESGDQTENHFIKFLKNNFGGQVDGENGNIYHFTSNGGILDVKGLDLAIKINDKWYSVQVKNNLEEAIKKIPYMGISVYPTNDKNGFNYCMKKNNEIITKKYNWQLS